MLQQFTCSARTLQQLYTFMSSSHPLCFCGPIVHFYMCYKVENNNVILFTLNNQLSIKEIRTQKSSLIFTYIFTILLYKSILYHFPSAQRTSFIIYYNAYLVLINYLRFCLKKVYILPSLLKDILL